MRSSLVVSNGDTYIFDENNFEEFSSFMKKNLNGKKVVLYITGRGTEPFRTNWIVAPYLEKHYDVQLFTFRWPSQGWLVGYPLKNAQEARKPLKICLEKFQRYTKQNNIRSSLFVHSMGNIVLQNFLQEYDNFLHENLFENIILNAADSDFQGHEKWVHKIDFAKRIYVTFNNCDRVLRVSQIFKNQGKERLGQLGYVANSPATYIDFSQSAASFNHEYFRRYPPHESLKIKRFFYEALRGKPISTYNLKKKAKNHYRIY